MGRHRGLIEPVLPELLPQRGAMDANLLGGHGTVALALAEHGPQQGGLDERQEPVVKGRVGLRSRSSVRSSASSHGWICRSILSLAWNGPGWRSSRRVGLRQMLGADLPSSRDDRRALDGVAQLPDVARPGAGRELIEHVVPERRRAAGQVQEAEEMAGQGRDVLAPVAERRNPDREDAEAEEEVLAEFARRPSARPAAGWSRPGSGR